MSKATPPALRSRTWKRFFRAPDAELLDGLYVPMLSAAVRYDRCCSYFSSSVLAAAARGFAPLIERLLGQEPNPDNPPIRLVVNEELSPSDVQALLETGYTSQLEAVLKKRFKNPKDILEKQRLAMLGYLAKHGYLVVRVGVMRSGGGMTHAKFGIATDEAGDAIVFAGSSNETAHGLLANYEEIEVSSSWGDPDRHQYFRDRFDHLWGDTDAAVHTVPLPEALQLKLIKFAPEEPPLVEPSNALARQKAAMAWRFLVEAPYLPNGGDTCDAMAMVDLWPHQRHVVHETAAAWPNGRLLCDEVGMGKTIEAILVLRRLFAGRGVRRVLLLLPAGLLKQWQAELREKGGLIFPRLEGLNRLVWPDDREEKVENLSAALTQDWLLMSRETARTEANTLHLLAAEPWDLVLLDEAHAARRKEQVETEYNSATLLLRLLRELQLRGQTRSILLLSATPMQTHPWEPWDLLAVLGEGGSWLAEFRLVREYYATIAGIQHGQCEASEARLSAALITSDALFPPPPMDGKHESDAEALANQLLFAPPSQREAWASWMRQGSPLARRMHRNTRNTLRTYYNQGLLNQAPPKRNVQDQVWDFKDQAERDVYDAIGAYIEKRFEELEQEKPGKGFVMTIYRRRASSSPHALRCSLERRREGLNRVARQMATSEYLDADTPEAIDPDELPDDITGKVSAALPQDPKTARSELTEVDNLLEALQNLQGRDSKRDGFFDILRTVTDDGRAVLVFTEYTDTLEYLRDALVPHYGKCLGCYSGDGGQRWNGQTWTSATKDAITKALHRKEIQVLLCTDAASEGLNLQAAGAVINYDLPWNPSKVEQRIGRVDRIGQKHSQVLVINLYLKDSVDDAVYSVLRQRCGLFEHFVGAMQPVLARARRMLLHQDASDTKALESSAAEVERDPLAGETYLENQAATLPAFSPAASREDLWRALELLDIDLGFKVTINATASTARLSGPGLSASAFSATVESLEHDRKASPLSVFDPRIRAIGETLARPGERLPLIIGSAQRDAFRTCIAYWVEGTQAAKVDTYQALQARIDAWTGAYPDPKTWHQTEQKARQEAAKTVSAAEQRAGADIQAASERQLGAARTRLIRELGRYLVCLEGDVANLNGLLYRQMQQHNPSGQRLKRCFEALGDYPDWPEHLYRELSDFAEHLPENRRKARLTGRELEAALADPRWEAGEALNR